MDMDELAKIEEIEEFADAIPCEGAVDRLPDCRCMSCKLRRMIASAKDENRPPDKEATLTTLDVYGFRKFERYALNMDCTKDFRFLSVDGKIEIVRWPEIPCQHCKFLELLAELRAERETANH